ncbi:MAG: tRNA (N(6)-L-threonylcarbamoyladenosine(37)-C(2))-methylthiotransferase MtaB [Cycloclasticus sp.]|nr:tRNA (N(6)-L-threonylcarbamoyladenosine(37)-C(2))-methylthiotransferase MtaB [Cycloclasticus sp.]MBQ0789339.1 tRNA (N(6)-L-threonylcarbamoyladenosine(37)-C(2))-methylthiotransferase MtaB [Cycloclasticus sp.]
MRVHLKTLGCRLNEAEIESWANDFGAKGHLIVQENDAPDALVINTCAVTQSAVRKSRQLIRKTHASNPKAKLIISGCYATLNADESASLQGVDLVVNNQQKDQLVALTLEHTNELTMPSMATEPNEVALFARGRQRAFIKVQDGCRYRCSFCIVTIARGEEKSRNIKDIVDEVNAIHKQGINEIVITGVHLGGYGSDIDSDLLALLTTLLEQTTVPRIRMGSLEPWDLPTGFFKLFKNPRLMPHLHLPIQSGSDTVLKRMSRRCKTDEFRSLVKAARVAVPGINITSDIIVGFPGESEKEWQETLDFVDEVKFSDLHIFSYSKREGTKAATMPEQVETVCKKSRSKALHQLTAKARHTLMASFIGSHCDVLWEDVQHTGEDGRSVVMGYTPNYLRVKTITSNPAAICNQIKACRLEAVDNNAMVASFDS